MRKLLISGVIILLFISGCTDKLIEPVDPLAFVIGQISFGPDSLIVDISQPLIISFLREMDQASVERSLSFEPEFEYRVHWTTDPHCNSSDPNCIPRYYQIYIYPENSFRTNQSYRGMIDTTAFDFDSNYLPIPYQFEFTTDSARLMKFTYISPNIDDNGVFPQIINLYFNAAVDTRTLQKPFMTDPHFEYELVDSSNYNSVLEYKITSPLRSETEYTLQISDPGIQDFYGNPISGQTQSGFTTDPIKVIYYYPNPDFKLKHDRPIIQVRFNTVMDRIACQNAFQITDSIFDLSGEFYWLTSGAMLYYLDSDLLHGTTYYICVDTTAADTFGHNLPQPFIHSFRLPD